MRTILLLLLGLAVAVRTDNMTFPEGKPIVTELGRYKAKVARAVNAQW